MKISLKNKLISLSHRHEELSRLLSEPDVVNDQNRYRDLSKEYAQLEPLVQSFSEYVDNEKNKEANELLLKENDPEIRQLAHDELKMLETAQLALEEKLQLLLLPKDPNDELSVFLEIRAGAGGNEAAIFAGDLFRMYSRFAERQGWSVSIVSEHGAEHGGYKEIIACIEGRGVYSQLKFESGAHRVQRVPVTESQGRVHTSTCTVAILPEIEEIESIDINPADLRIDTYRASGAGGQHVNKTDSAVRITHIPTGVVVECQDERSQHKNKARAMSLLHARLLDAEQSKQQKNQAETRRNLVGTGDRSERIRTYNFPQSRLTDHRINLTLYQLESIMNGDLQPVIEPLIRELQAEQLANLTQENF